ncbi:hypothetical protein D3C80_1619130 [compost metagenome]
MWSVVPARQKKSQVICFRSMGVPQTSRALGRVRALVLNISTSSPWKAAGRRVVSLFQ